MQNANAKFRKVGQRHYSGEVENVYISVRQIYSGQCVSNFIAIGLFCRLYIKKTFWCFFRFTLGRMLRIPNFNSLPIWHCAPFRLILLDLLWIVEACCMDFLYNRSTTIHNKWKQVEFELNDVMRHNPTSTL